VFLLSVLRSAVLIAVLRRAENTEPFTATTPAGRFIVYDNGRPALFASQLAYADRVAEGDRKVVGCPRCSRVVRVRRRMIDQHVIPDDVPGRDPDCSGSFQLIEFDLTQEQCDQRRAEHAHQREVHGLNLRRGTHVQPRPKPALAPPIAHLRRDRTPRRAQIEGWSSPESDTWTWNNR
jgi:hypothetical protein